MKKHKNTKKRKLKLLTILLLIGDIIAIAGFVMMYGPWNYFRNLYVTTAMRTMHHQYFANIFYNDETIRKIMDNNYFVAIEEDADVEKIEIDTKEKKTYKDDYEKDLFTRTPGNDLYKVINLKIGGSDAYLVAIYDPTKVHLIRTANFNVGRYGERVLTMCERYKGVACINGGGFVDHGYGSDIPMGYVIEGGKIVWSDGDPNTTRGNIIGLTTDGKLKLMSNATGEEALNNGIVEALEFGPFLIVNGKSLEIVGDPWGKAPRMAIAQRKDGLIMFLAIDGENYINGASLKEMIETLEKYGAYNAANLDGGQSASLVINNKLYNSPPPAAKAQGGRYVVTGFGLIP